MGIIEGLGVVGLILGATPQIMWQLTPDYGYTEKVHGLTLCCDSESIVFAGEFNQDIWVYKLSQDSGDSIWAQVYDNDAGEDIGYDVAVAPNGVVFVGATSLTATDPKLFSCSYSAAGDLLWTQPLIQNGEFNDVSIYCRNSDSCYLAGWRWFANNVYPTVYLINEKGVYEKLRGDEGTVTSYALTGVDIDNNGYVYLSFSALTGCRLIKNNPDASYIWNQGYEESDVNLKGWQCRLGPSQEVFFCGERAQAESDFLMLKWSSEGTLLWDPGKHYDLGHDEYCRDMWVDAISDCYLAGWQVRGTEEDAALVKTDSAGNMLWSWVYEQEGDQEIEAIEVDEDGYIYLAGSHHNGENWDMLVMQVRQPLEVSGFLDDGTDNPTLSDVTILITGDTTLEILTDSEAKYSIELYNGGTYTFTPQLAGWMFEPASYTYDPLAHREMNQDFWGEWTGVEENPHGLLPHWKLISSCGPQITLSYINYPDGFSADVFDAAGRQVDELHVPQTGGTVSWPVTPGAGHSPGVYFIVPQGGNLTAQKVVLVR